MLLSVGGSHTRSNSSAPKSTCSADGRGWIIPTPWRDRFNFDGAGKGFSIDPDEFYLSWPRNSTPEQVEVCDWLKSLTPEQELARFLANRAHILADVLKDDNRALVVYSECARLQSNRSTLQAVAETFGRRWQREMADHAKIYAQEAQARKKDTELDQGQERRTYLPPPRGRPAQDPLAGIEVINEINRRNMQLMKQPLRAAQPQVSYGQPGAAQAYEPSMPGQVPR
jgi:uncharacterized protein YeaO (DUF488 family)